MFRFTALSLIAAVLLVALVVPAQSASITVTDAILSGPGTILCPPPCNQATYTISLAGTGASSTVANWFNWSVYQDEVVDDELVAETADYTFGDGSAGTWSKIITFQLWCDGDCDVTGPAGSTWDSTAQVYALIETSAGTDLAETNRLTVSCVPEPATFALMALGLAGIGLWRRRRGPGR